MRTRRPYCRDRMCGAIDCSTCYGPGYDHEDDEDDDDVSDLFEDGGEDCDDPDDAIELPLDVGQ